MTTALECLPLTVQIMLFPLIWISIDSFGGVRAVHAEPAPTSASSELDDFTVLVPIYGSVSYLRNACWLSASGARVWLLTTTAETPEFVQALNRIAMERGFTVMSSRVPGRRNGKRRATSGVMRDTLVRDALEFVTTDFVVCVDADTTIIGRLGELVSIMDENDIDFASLRLVPANTGRWLGKLQGYEYRLAMRLRLLAPWLVSGACHAARTAVHREIMRRHSLFFQGNDIEAGVLASMLGYRVGHIPFEVCTHVPDTVRAWFRQRLAWAGGEFRLFAVNARLIRQHAWFWLYGLVLVLLALPLRWFSLTEVGWSLAITYVLYLAVSLHLHKSSLNCWILALPLYAAFSSLVMTPLGVVWYFVMAWRDHNFGIIRLDHLVLRRGDEAVRFRKPRSPCKEDQDANCRLERQ